MEQGKADGLGQDGLERALEHTSRPRSSVGDWDEAPAMGLRPLHGYPRNLPSASDQTCPA